MHRSKMKENILLIIVEVIAGKYIQLKNLVIEIEYSYFISGLFKSVDVEGTSIICYTCI